MVGLTASLRDTIKVDTVIDTIWWDDEYFVDTIYILPWNGVSDAEVVLNNGSQSFTLKEDPDSAGYYYLNDPGFAAGQTWQLEVQSPQWDEISAKTTFPGEFEIHAPAKDTINYYDTLAWTKSNGAKGYSIAILLWYTRDAGDTLIVDSLVDFYPRLLPDDTCFIIIEDIGWWWELADSVVFIVVALDTNAYDYYYYHRNYYYFFFDDEDTLNIDDYMHIEGALGVFGSQTVISRKYFLENYEFPR
jgi:hypothetical protein